MKIDAKEKCNIINRRGNRVKTSLFFPSFFITNEIRFFVCITYKINEEKLRTCIKGGPINNRRAASTLSILSSFFLTNHTSFVYLCTRAFNNRFWPRFNFTLFTYKIDWNVFVITKPQTQVEYDYFLDLSNFLFPQKWRGRKVIHYMKRKELMILLVWNEYICWAC